MNAALQRHSTGRKIRSGCGHWNGGWQSRLANSSGFSLRDMIPNLSELRKRHPYRPVIAQNVMTIPPGYPKILGRRTISDVVRFGNSRGCITNEKVQVRDQG